MRELNQSATLLSLHTRAFRNLAARSLVLPPERRIRILVGANGAGKTSLMEAISVLAPGRGLRSARLGEILRAGAPVAEGWSVKARLTDRFGAARCVRIQALPAGDAAPGDEGMWENGGKVGGNGADSAPRLRRQVVIDGRRRSPAALSELVGLAWATPAMDRLFVEGAAARRRFFDRLAAAFFPDHPRLLARYERAMRERLRLLAGDRRAADPHWLSALEAQLAETGVAIAAARVETAGMLNACAQERSISGFPVPRLACAGYVEESILSGTPALLVEERLREAFAERRGADRREQRTGIGVHVSDIVVTGLFPGAREPRPARLASTGEQKVLLLALILAHAELAADKAAVPVILLLDEVAAHLDGGRRALLFERLARFGGEVWLSGTDRSLFAPLEKLDEPVLLAIDEGRVDH